MAAGRAGRRAQRSAPSGQTGQKPVPRRAGSVGRERSSYAPHTLQAPHTADGVPANEHGGGRGAGSPVGYKPYTGKVSSEYQVLGRLKPDLNTDELVQKRQNLAKIKLFSRNLRIVNREEEAQIAEARRERESAMPQQAAPAPALSKAQKAREYAKQSVPKPRPRREPAQGGALGSASGEGGESGAGEADGLDELALLERQHNEYVAQAAAIRAELGL